jgi:hypothetical protein
MRKLDLENVLNELRKKVDETKEHPMIQIDNGDCFEILALTKRLMNQTYINGGNINAVNNRI